MTRYIQNKDYDVTELDRDYLILNTDQFTVTKLNEVGGFCWTLLKDPQSVEGLALAVQNQFGFSSDQNRITQEEVSTHTNDHTTNQIEEDIRSFLSDLERCRLIRHVS